VVDVVYKAEEARLGRHVVMKFSTDEYSGYRRAPDRFLHGRTASPLNHPKICTIRDVAEFEPQQAAVRVRGSR